MYINQAHDRRFLDTPQVPAKEPLILHMPWIFGHNLLEEIGLV
jgi:hypothetical protein